jgi:hypothetical protein
MKGEVTIIAVLGAGGGKGVGQRKNRWSSHYSVFLSIHQHLIDKFFDRKNFTVFLLIYFLVASIFQRMYCIFN